MKWKQNFPKILRLESSKLKYPQIINFRITFKSIYPTCVPQLLPSIDRSIRPLSVKQGSTSSSSIPFPQEIKHPLNQSSLVQKQFSPCRNDARFRGTVAWQRATARVYLSQDSRATKQGFPIRFPVPADPWTTRTTRKRCAALERERGLPRRQLYVYMRPYTTVSRYRAGHTSPNRDPRGGRRRCCCPPSKLGAVSRFVSLPSFLARFDRKI